MGVCCCGKEILGQQIILADDAIIIFRQFQIMQMVI